MHAEINQQTIELIGYLLGLLGSVTVAFSGILIWIGKMVSSKMEKLDASVNNSIGKLTTTIIAIKDEFNEKHNRHETKIAVMEEHLNHHVERRKS